jgi:hypothetical protein
MCAQRTEMSRAKLQRASTATRFWRALKTRFGRQRIGKIWRWMFPRLKCPRCDKWASRKNRTLFRRNHIIFECECGHVNSVLAWRDLHGNIITSPLLPAKTDGHHIVPSTP